MGKSAILRSRFADRATRLLATRGLALDELAARAGLPVARVSSILRGTLVAMTLADMSLIAGVLGAPLFGLLAPVELAVPVVSIEEVEKRGPRHA